MLFIIPNISGISLWSLMRTVNVQEVYENRLQACVMDKILPHAVMAIALQNCSDALYWQVQEC